MKVINNYRAVVSEGDRFLSLKNKKDLIYLIKKFFVNNDGSKPKTTELQRMKRGQLYYAFVKNKPADLFKGVK